MEQVRLFISGMVQNVGFRRYVHKQANELGLTGWVRNLPDGRVEALLQGGRQQIELLIEACRQGPFLAEVEEVEVIWEEGEEEHTTFTIRNMPS